MDNKGFMQWFKKVFLPGGETGKKPAKAQYVLIILGAGVLFMLMGNFFTDKPPSIKEGAVPVLKANQEETPVFGGQKKDLEAKAIHEYESQYENELKDALETITGVDDVTVVVNVDSTETKILEKNTVTQEQITDETDREGGKRNVQDTSKDEQVVIVRSGDQETPIVLKIEKPKISGVLVTAKGANNVHIKKMIIEAVTRVLNVESHRVAVLPKKTKGD